jgi:hypothetical protein
MVASEYSSRSVYLLFEKLARIYHLVRAGACPPSTFFVEPQSNEWDACAQQDVDEPILVMISI